jgi:hypothetical protein
MSPLGLIPKAKVSGPGDASPGASVTIGNDINNRGDVLGWFTLDPNGQTGFQGYVLRGNNYILTFAYPGANVTNTYAIGFNQAGTIVGSFTTTTPGVEHGFVRSADGRFTQLDFPSSVQQCAGNIDGQIVAIPGDESMEVAIGIKVEAANQAVGRDPNVQSGAGRTKTDRGECVSVSRRCESSEHERNEK